MLQSRLTARYLELVKNIYIEPGEDKVVGNIFHFVMTLLPIVNTPVSIKRKKKAAATNATTNHDMRFIGHDFDIDEFARPLLENGVDVVVASQVLPGG